MNDNKKLYDTIIIGGGPAGVAAAVYAGRKQMDTLLIAESFGGQSVVSDRIENWIGERSISGFELAQKLEAHARAQARVEIKSGERVEKVEHVKCGLKVVTNKAVYVSRTLIIASGGRHRKLGIPGEEKFNGRGVAYCSTCDAPFFRGKTVAVVGGGNSGLEAVIDLKPYAKKVYLLINSEKPTGDPHTLEEIKKEDLAEIICCSKIYSIEGEASVTGIRYKANDSGEDKSLPVDGVFVEIGSMPNTEFLGTLVEKNEYGEIIIDPIRATTSMPGVFAAGDATNDIYKQNNIAAGDAVRAALSAYYYNLDIRKKSKMEDCDLTSVFS